MLEHHDRSITFCSFCPKLCRFACPVAHAEARETVTPQAKQALADLVRRGEVALDAEVADVFYRCTGCQLHTTACEHDIHVGPVMFDARAEAVRAGAGHPALEGLAAELDADEARHREALTECCGEAPSRRGTLFFAGCDALEQDGALARDGFAAARRLLGAVAPAETPGCCGYPLLAGGFPEAFALRARRVAGALSGADLVVTGDPRCAWTFRTAYRDAGVDGLPPVRHLAEVAAERPDRLPAAPAGGPTAYHDPCYLGRRLGVTEAPREVLRWLLGRVPMELPWAERGGYCSGGGGLLPRTAPETAAAVASDLAAQVDDVGAARVVTACPRCHRALSEAGGAAEVVDLATLLAGDG